MKTKGSPNIVDIHVGKRLRVARELKSMSQEKLGGSLSPTLTFQQIQKYENGHNRISTGRLYEIAKVLNLPFDFFFDGLDQSGGIDPRDQIIDDLRAGLEGIRVITDHVFKGKKTKGISLRCSNLLLDIVNASGSRA